MKKLIAEIITGPHSYMTVTPIKIRYEIYTHVAMDLLSTQMLYLKSQTTKSESFIKELCLWKPLKFHASSWITSTVIRFIHHSQQFEDTRMSCCKVQLGPLLRTSGGFWKLS